MSTVVETVTELVKPILAEHNFYLYDMEFVKERTETLRQDAMQFSREAQTGAGTIIKNAMLESMPLRMLSPLFYEETEQTDFSYLFLG